MKPLPQFLRHLFLATTFTKKIIFCLTLLTCSFSVTRATIHDSIGVEKKDGKVFVLHKVEPKETLYSISKKYNAKIDEIKLANPEMTGELSIGQTLRIPYKGKLTSTSELGAVKIHKVEKKETLYAISKKYNVSVESIISLNPGSDKSLVEGQELKIPKGTTQMGNANVVATPVAVQTNPVSAEEYKGKIHVVVADETLFGISKKYDANIDEIKKLNPQLIDGLKEGMELKIPEQQKNSVEETNASTVSTSTSKGETKKITEKGLAEKFDTQTTSPKFQALHKTAPIGTIIQVINESNNQKIFVRVVGKFTAASDSKTIIKLAQKALDRLEVKDSKIPVTLIYIP